MIQNINVRFLRGYLKPCLGIYARARGKSRSCVCLAPVASVPGPALSLASAGVPEESSCRLDDDPSAFRDGEHAMISRTSVGLTGATARAKQHACPSSWPEHPLVRVARLRKRFCASRLLSAAYSISRAGEKRQLTRAGSAPRRAKPGQPSPSDTRSRCASYRARNRGSSWPSGPAAAARLIQMVPIRGRPRRRRQLVERTGSAWSTSIGEC